MRRFLDGRYSSSHSLPGVMLGYLSGVSPSAALRLVNAAISHEPDLAAADHLVPTGSQATIQRHKSNHAGPIQLVHFHIKIK
ncbi:hypothetical protein GCM10011381_00380 [Klenkia taihuensis]|nr:hypothetical protein GCM10011381_00380 [Klenkia taihuensis]